MNTLKMLGQIYSIAIGALVILFIGLIAYRIIRVFIQKTERQSIFTIENNRYPKILKVLFGMSMLFILVDAPFYGVIASAFKRLVPSYLNNLFVCASIFLAGLECYLALSVSKKLIDTTVKKVMLTAIVIFLLPISIFLAIQIPAMFTYPREQACYLIDLPVKGTWAAGHAGGSEIVNYHCAIQSQTYAMDIVKVNEAGEFFKGEGKELEDIYTFGENIYAPVRGRIVNVVDSLPNTHITFQPNERKNPAGNHVVIELEKDRYVFLAHFNRGSIKVQLGDTINSGDLIGQAGNSGNTSWPHLHMHIQDKPTISKEAKAFPFRFKSINRKRWMAWEKIGNGYLIRNDLFNRP